MHLRLAAVAACTIVAVQPVSSAYAQRRDLDRMSGEGQAALKDFYAKGNPAVQDCIKEKGRIEVQLQEEANKSELDWKAASALLKKQAAVDSRCSIVFKISSLDMLEALPPADRAIFFRNLYRKYAPPIISKVTTEAAKRDEAANSPK